MKAKVGPDAHVICALSGGVDSAVAATLVHKAIGRGWYMSPYPAIPIG